MQHSVLRRWGRGIGSGVVGLTCLGMVSSPLNAATTSATIERELIGLEAWMKEPDAELRSTPDEGVGDEEMALLFGDSGVGRGGPRNAAANGERLPFYAPSTLAAGLRLREPLPELPSRLVKRGTDYVLVYDICVSPSGDVTDVILKRGAPPELDRVVTAAIQKWQYRPWRIEGTAIPFCHAMRITYSNE